MANEGTDIRAPVRIPGMRSTSAARDPESSVSICTVPCSASSSSCKEEVSWLSLKQVKEIHMAHSDRENGLRRQRAVLSGSDLCSYPHGSGPPLRSVETQSPPQEAVSFSHATWMFCSKKEVVIVQCVLGDVCIPRAWWVTDKHSMKVIHTCTCPELSRRWHGAPTLAVSYRAWKKPTAQGTSRMAAGSFTQDTDSALGIPKKPTALFCFTEQHGLLAN